VLNQVPEVMNQHDGELISIAMCTYNGEEYLSEQLDSIVNQSYRNLEIVIVDDCSADNTLGLLKEYALRDSRIRIISNDKNIGFVRNFEKAMSECKGDLIALADQDDIWFPEKIARLAASIGDSWLIYSEVTVINSDGVEQDVRFPTVKRIDGSCALSLILNNCVTGHACLMRRKLLTVAMPSMSDMPYHDQWLAIVAGAHGKLKASDEVLSFYRKHGGNAVLKSKSKRKESKVVSANKKFYKTCKFVSLVISSGVLSKEDCERLSEFYRLFSRNELVVYNFKLKKFLFDNADDFLRLFDDRERAAKKFCRGKWYFLLVPFS
jgi:glycosyltransferase involved in cell wall biosynthesis